MNVFALQLELTRTGFAFARMAAEANTVIMIRMMGSAGGWTGSEAESRRMVSEKPPAFIEASIAASRAAMTGALAHDIMSAWLKPISRLTRANSRRLTRRRH